MGIRDPRLTRWHYQWAVADFLPRFAGKTLICLIGTVYRNRKDPVITLNQWRPRTSKAGGSRVRPPFRHGLHS
jgi:hypothetical protein